MSEETRALLEKWRIKATALRNAHYEASVRLRRYHYVTGVPGVVLSAIVGTAVFASLEATVNWKIKVTVACISVMATSLAALQTFLRYGERAETHRRIYAGYEAVVADIDVALLDVDKEDAERGESRIEEIKERLRELFEAAPELSMIDRTFGSGFPKKIAASSAPTIIIPSSDHSLKVSYEEQRPLGFVPSTPAPPPRHSEDRDQ